MMSRIHFFAMSTIFLSACGGSSTASPPKTEEVPIGTQSSKREAKRPDPDEGEDVTHAPAGSPAAAAALPPPSAPAAPAAPGPPATASTTSTTTKSDSKTSRAGAAAGSKGGGKTGGGVLSKAECDQMMDKYIDVVVTGDGAPLKGMSGKELADARAMIKSSVAQDPNFQGFKAACLRDLSKAQYACAMQARATEEFQNCIR